MNLYDINIETERLLLVPITLEYADDIFRYFTADVTKYMYPKPACDISEIKAFIESSIKSMRMGTNIQLVILLKNTKEFVGCVGLHNLNDVPEFGIWTKIDAHGNGYGRESIHALYHWACRNLEFEYITYPVDKRNVASRNIPESLAGKVAKEYKQINASGFELDEVEYHIYPIKE
jgi:RimJ/RimL family protein N-acetyltransferase